MTDDFGNWVLPPELCHYSTGAAPEKGTCRISQDGEQVRFDVAWTVAGADMGISFSAPADGTQSQSDFPGVDSFSVLHEDEQTLSGDAISIGAQVSKVIQRVSSDRHLKTVLQENADRVDGLIRIFQVYQHA